MVQAEWILQLDRGILQTEEHIGCEPDARHHEAPEVDDNHEGERHQVEKEDAPQVRHVHEWHRREQTLCIPDSLLQTPQRIVDCHVQRQARPSSHCVCKATSHHPGGVVWHVIVHVYLRNLLLAQDTRQHARADAHVTKVTTRRYYCGNGVLDHRLAQLVVRDESANLLSESSTEAHNASECHTAIPPFAKGVLRPEDDEEHHRARQHPMKRAGKFKGLGPLW
mmetsp:Transcript_119495/g.338166  ORF Transcript_119495/g.338166 Transcript_119495/m.338166 type:complete len:223 (-) Transcript_119495:2700-3368(-)